MADSPRWCDRCQRWGDHHTDRHPAPVPRRDEGDAERLADHRLAAQLAEQVRLAVPAMLPGYPERIAESALPWLASLLAATRAEALREAADKRQGWTHEEAKRHTLIERLHERCALYGGATCPEKTGLPHEDWCERCLAAEALPATPEGD